MPQKAVKHYLNHRCLLFGAKSISLHRQIVARTCWLLVAAGLIGVCRAKTKNFYWKVVKSCFLADLDRMSIFAVIFKKTIPSTYGFCFALSNRQQTQKLFLQQSSVYLTPLSRLCDPKIPCSLTHASDANSTLLEVFE